MNVAIILAGGVGSRVGAEQPKQFIEVLGKPILVYTIEKFQNHEEIDGIEVVCVASHMEYMRELKEKYQLTKVKWIVEGGSTFQESVIHGVDHLKGILQKKDQVLIHYGASPFVEEEIITDAIKVCREKGNCTSATPIFLLTGKRDAGDSSSQWVDRDSIVGLNAPQTFQFGYVTQLYDEARENNILDQVEPHTTSLMFKMGRTIYLSKGNQTNIKITTKEDVELFEGYALLQKMKRRRNENECNTETFDEIGSGD